MFYINVIENVDTNQCFVFHSFPYISQYILIRYGHVCASPMSYGNQTNMDGIGWDIIHVKISGWVACVLTI